MLREFEKQLSSKFKVTFQGHAHWFLSMRILQDKNENITLDQSCYAKNLVQRHLGNSMPINKVSRTLPAEFIATKNDCSKNEKEVEQLSEEYRIDYPSAIGSLIYLLNTRPDLTFAVTKLAKYMKLSGRNHFMGVIHKLKYVRDNNSLGLKYFHLWNDSPIYKVLKNNDLMVTHDIFGTHDSSWQDCPDTGKSTGCYVQFMQVGPVDYSTYVPTPVAMSSAE